MTSFIPLHYSFFSFFSFCDRRSHLKIMFEQYPCNPNNELWYNQSSQRYMKTVGLLVCLRESEGSSPFLIMPINLPLSTDTEETGDFYRHTLSTIISLKMPSDSLWMYQVRSSFLSSWFSKQGNLHFLFFYGPKRSIRCLPYQWIHHYKLHQSYGWKIGKTVFAILATSYIMCTFPPEHVLTFCS